MNSLRNEWYRRELYESESEAYHRPMEKEYSFYSAVKNGDMEFVRKNLNQGDFTCPIFSLARPYSSRTINCVSIGTMDEHIALASAIGTLTSNLYFPE